jgi:hypothetical protein
MFERDVDWHNHSSNCVNAYIGTTSPHMQNGKAMHILQGSGQISVLLVHACLYVDFLLKRAA